MSTFFSSLTTNIETQVRHSHILKRPSRLSLLLAVAVNSVVLLHVIVIYDVNRM